MHNPRARSLPPIHYRIDIANPHTHLYTVTLTVAAPAARQVLRLPVWIPGSYLVREFAKHLQNLQAHQGRRSVAVQQLDKASWSVDCDPGKPLEVRYEVYAFDTSVRTAWLDATRGFFNGTSLCLLVEGQQASPHALELVAGDGMDGWSVATGLEPAKVNKRGFGRYHAAASPPAASRTASSWPGHRPASTAPSCWPTPRPSARPKSASGMARNAPKNRAGHARLARARARFHSNTMSSC